VIFEKNTYLLSVRNSHFHEMGKTLQLEELKVYLVAMEIGEIVWNLINKWDYFSKKTLGAQFIEAADSIALNISEGYGRYHYKENKNFNYYSRGSAKETSTVLKKAIDRTLISQEDFILLKQKLDLYFRLSYGYIQSIGKTKNIDMSM